MKHTTHSEQELRKEVELLIGEEIVEPVAKGNYGYTQSKLAMDKLMQLIQSERKKVLEEVIRLRPDYYTKDQLGFYDKAPDSYGLKKDSPEWYNLALSQWEKKLAKLAQKEESK